MQNIGGAPAGWGTVGLLLVVAVAVVVGTWLYWAGAPPAVFCPKRLDSRPDGSLVLQPSGQSFADMNAFQQWWHGSSGLNSVCPIPVLSGVPTAGEVAATATGPAWGTEQTFATTPIYKVDDYEFSRVFGYERDGRMMVPRQNYNEILEARALDWADKPLSSDERRDKYAGLREGFTAAGELTATEVAVRDARAQFGSKEEADAAEVECRMSRQDREVAKLVARAYASDPAWEPVVTKVGANHWEVNELRPRARHGAIAPQPYQERVVNTGEDAVDVRFRYRQQADIDAAIDPYFSGYPSRTGDPYQGTVPGLERMFGPTFDKAQWY
ncbi:hypothetical protein EBZ80_16105 [bacterium]|nr:hypothetical protein [bacterium]